VAGNAVATKAKEEQPLKQEVTTDTPGAWGLTPEQTTQDKNKKIQLSHTTTQLKTQKLF